MSYSAETRDASQSYGNESRVSSSNYSGLGKDFTSYLVLTDETNVLDVGGGFMLTTDETYGGNYSGEVRDNT
jgi:hypothetical protein